MIYIDSKVQLINTSVVYVRVFKFSFRQLDVKIEANNLRFSANRMKRLMQVMFAKRASTSPDLLSKISWPELRCPDDACWPWVVTDFSCLVSEPSSARPIHFSGVDSQGCFAFTFRL